MISPPSLHHHTCNLPFQSQSPNTHSRPHSHRTHFFPPKLIPRRLPTLTSASISQIHTYDNAIDYEARPMVTWRDVCKKMFASQNNTAVLLDQLENDGKKLTRWEISKLIKELRKYKRFSRALEVFDWMNSVDKRYQLTPSEAAIQLDLISKVRGITAAERHFQNIPEASKDGRVYGSMLNCYAQSKMVESAESLLETMRVKGYATQSLTFNVMMTLYTNLKQFENVEKTIEEMRQKGIRLDIYSYNIWLSSRGVNGSIEEMERVFELMTKDRFIVPNWSTYTTLATMYVKMGEIQKAEDCLSKTESRLTGRDRAPFHYLLTLYGNCRNRQGVYRVWKMYKSEFGFIPNMGYHSVISSLVRIGDVEGAEEMYREWVLTNPTCDTRLPNLLIGCYAKHGEMEKAEGIFRQIEELGGKPTPYTWEILADGYVLVGKSREALTCLEKCFADESNRWKLKQEIFGNFVALCEKEAEIGRKEALIDLCTKAGYFENVRNI